MYHRLPDDLATEEARGITISVDEVGRFEEAKQALAADPRFKYLRDHHRRAHGRGLAVCLPSGALPIYQITSTGSFESMNG